MEIELQALAPESFGARCLDPVKELAETEQLLGISLPYGLRSLLLKYGGALVFGNGARFIPDQRSGREGADGFLSLVSLYGLGDDENGLRAIYRVYEAEVSPKIIMIGDASGGDQICIEKNSGEIFYWRHDVDANDVALTLIAGNFQEFAERLLPDSSDLQNCSDLGVIEGESFLDF